MNKYAIQFATADQASLEVTVRFFVAGLPRPKGSLRAQPIPRRGGGWLTDRVGRPVVAVRNDSGGLVEWQDQVARRARQEWASSPAPFPFELELEFQLPRPRSEWAARFDGALRKGASVYPTRRPDLDKLERAILDALTGVVYVDDSQVVGITSRKRFHAKVLDPTGVWVTVRRLL